MFPPPQPTEQFPYKIECKIGEGAMGEVYCAVEPALNRKVAIKVLKSGFLENMPLDKAQEIKQRFVQEAQAAARLSHPGCATIYRIGYNSADPFIAMEWLDGQTLEDLIETQAPLPVDRVAQIGIELLDTLDAAHRAGIVHRDVKPANVMILNDGRVKLADFGVARMQGSSLVETQAGTVLGTPLYASPEQLHGHDVDGRADVYSVGVLLYESLSGKLPYEAKSLISLMQLILSPQPPVSPEQHNQSIPHGVSQVIMTAISKRREDRYDTAAMMSQMLAPFAQPAASADMPMAKTIQTPTDDMLRVTAPVHMVAGYDKTQMVASLIQSWPGKSLGEQPVDALLSKLMERPLHTPAFCGVAQVGSAFFLLQNGLIYAVFDPLQGLVSDAVYEGLPPTAPCKLYNLPESFPPNLVVYLASMLQVPRVRHGNLDASYVAIPQMVGKLINDKFSGVVKFQRGAALAYLLIERGVPLIHLFSADWLEQPAQHPWPGWIAQAGVTASIEEHRVVLSSVSYHRELKDYTFSVKALPPDKDALKSNSDLRRTKSVSSSVITGGYELVPNNEATTRLSGSALTQIYMSDPMYAFLHWMGRDLPVFFAERERVKRWKYLVEWVGLVKTARLYHELPRPQSNETDAFDLVTFDDKGKVLHLVSRYTEGSAEAMESFINRVITAKKARIKTGDVGGAVFIAPNITPEALALYDKMTSEEEKKKRFFFSLQDSVTGYEGFVRIGARRGFHLLLISEKDDGFQPILPAG